VSEAKANFLDVEILGREYRVICPPGEEEALHAAVLMVDEKMRDIAAKAKSMTSERVAVMAALNIAHEYLDATQKKTNAPERQRSFDSADAKRRIEAMDTRLDALLAQQELER
jgi:cell division protein ZapA